MFWRTRTWYRRRFGAMPSGGILGPQNPDAVLQASQIQGFGGPQPIARAEQAYIKRYRANLERLDRRDGLPVLPKERPVLGLALSGGGVRSASIALGVMQALAAGDRLRKFDYLSTVSGGGYTGSATTWFTSPRCNGGGLPTFSTRQGDSKRWPIRSFAFGTRDTVTPAQYPLSDAERILSFLRHHASYLTPGMGINVVSAVAVVLRGVLVNLFIWVPIVSSILLFAILISPPEDARPKAFTWDAIPDVFLWALLSAGALVALFWLAGIVYSLMTYKARVKSQSVDRLKLRLGSWVELLVSPGYRVRRAFDRYVPGLLVLAGVLLLIGVLPIAYVVMRERAAEVSLSSILGGIVSGFWTFWQSRQHSKQVPSFVSGLVAPLGSFLLLYGLLLASYCVAYAVALPPQSEVGWLSEFGASVGDVLKLISVGLIDIDRINLPTAIIGWLALTVLAVATAWFVNLNYTTLHRYYHDRLMESFLPDLHGALADRTGPARLADRARLSAMCKAAFGPYHLINCNVILNDSEESRRRLRGGDSFILSPKYCGSSATGWIETNQWIGNSMTLSTAMAISGAAANPGAGTGGVGPTRSRTVSVLMAMLNLRLGYWVPNPVLGPTRDVKPNHFSPGLTEMLMPERKEDSAILQLSDGGHFDNLGLYELIRRNVEVIVVSDGTADPTFAFGDLLTLLPRIREDFGVAVAFDTALAGSAAPHLPAPIDAIIPFVNAAGTARYPAGAALAKCGYAFARITYANGSTGTLIYLKAAALEEMDFELLGYKGQKPDFPNETTLDQFYSEAKFEAHRGLGYNLTRQMLANISQHTGRHPGLANL
jgi:hypothetical protein